MDAGSMDARAGDAGGVDAGDAGDATDADTFDAPTPVCPNGVVEPGESCDDNNATPGDGCSPGCQIEGDSCADPIDLGLVSTVQPDGSLRYVGSLVWATDRVPFGGCDSVEMIERTYHWRAPGDGVAVVHTDDPASEIEVVLSIRRTCEDPASELACNVGGATRSGPSRVEFPVTGSTDYQVIVAPHWVADCCAFAILTEYHPYLAAAEPCDPVSTVDLCAPGLACAATDGGFSCQ
jgi:cysteine-rich repeat protein